MKSTFKFLSSHPKERESFQQPVQVIKSRYGGKTHIIVLIFGLFTNIIVTLSLLLGGTAVLTGLVQVSKLLKIV